MLIGMMGAGKSSVGRCLQQRTGLARFDTDELIAAKFGCSIPEVFARHGEDRFRAAETETLRELFSDRPAIIVTGGGIVIRLENVDLLKALGTIVWLSADENILFERASRRGNRPLLKTEDPRKCFSEILTARAPLYEQAADFRIDSGPRSHDEVADLILEEVEKRRSI